jgi:hypothetical protein
MFTTAGLLIMILKSKNLKGETKMESTERAETSMALREALRALAREHMDSLMKAGANHG